MQNQKHHFYLKTNTGEIFRKKKDLYIAFLDLEKASDQVPRNGVGCALMKLRCTRVVT